MISNNLSKILGERRMTQKELSVLTGIRAATINEIYHDMAARYSVEHLDKICESLDIDICEFFTYKKNQIKTTGKNLILEEHGNRKKQ